MNIDGLQALLLGAFLSRLCGGERHHPDKSLLFSFLSRLCGGEHAQWPIVCRFEFLSRLCGGEQKRTDSRHKK